MIIRRKLFSNLDPIPYKSRFQRLGNAIQGTFGGIIGGGIAGSMIGILGGFKGMRTGAIIGASLGALFGSKLGWESGSKKNIDRENKRRARLREQVENPDKYFQGLFKEDQNISYRLKAIESKFDMKFSRDLYKLIRIRKQFAPSIIEWFRKYNNPEYGSKLFSVPMSIMYDVFPNAIEADLEVGINDLKLDNPGCAVLIDPGQGDDTFIVYHPKTGKYGFDITEEDGKYNSLKDAIIDLCKDEIDFLNKSGKQFDKDGALADLQNRWLNFINQKL